MQQQTGETGSVLSVVDDRPRMPWPQKVARVSVSLQTLRRSFLTFTRRVASRVDPWSIIREIKCQGFMTVQH